MHKFNQTPEDIGVVLHNGNHQVGRGLDQGPGFVVSCLLSKVFENQLVEHPVYGREENCLVVAQLRELRF